MKAFSKRPLSTILFVMLGGFLLFAILPIYLSLAILAIGAVLFILTFFGISFFSDHKILIRICAVVLFLSMALSGIYFNFFFKADQRFKRETVYIEATVLTVENELYRNDITIETDSINGETMSKCRLKMSPEFDETPRLEPGDKISFYGIIDEFSYSALYNLSKGFSGEIRDIKNVSITGRSDLPIDVKLASFRAKLTDRMISIFGSDAGGLLSALLLGERESLSPQLELDFRRIGISHILALSGLHLSILAIGFSKLLSLFGLGKKGCTVASIIFTLLYMALCGFPVTVLRAGIMLIISSLLYLFAKTKDSFTNLFIAVTLICIVTPYAILDISLWLSALATLGIVIISEHLSNRDAKEKESLAKRILDSLKSSFLAGVFALGGTLALSVFAFEGISLISPISTILFATLSEIFIYAGSILLIFGGMGPLGEILSFLYQIIAVPAGALSDVDFIYGSTDFIHLKILALLFTAAFFAFIVLDVKKKKLYITTLTVMLFTVVSVSSISTAIASSYPRYEYIREESNEIIICTDQGSTMLIDQTSSTASAIRRTSEILAEAYELCLEKYVIADYTAALASSLDKILSKTRIKNIYLPEPLVESEISMLSAIKSSISDFRVNIILYSRKEKITNGKYSFSEIYRADADKPYDKNAFMIESDEKSLVYLSSGFLEGMTKNAALEEMANADTIILGRHGQAYSDYVFTFKISSIEKLIFASKNMLMHSDTRLYYNDIDFMISPEVADLKR